MPKTPMTAAGGAGRDGWREVGTAVFEDAAGDTPLHQKQRRLLARPGPKGKPGLSLRKTPAAA